MKYICNENARQCCTQRIALAAQEDWGLETRELITDMFRWKIETITLP